MNKELYGQMEKGADNKYSIVASTGNEDRDGEKILPTSFKNLKSYLSKNPVILWAHDYRKPPIAKATAGKITDNGVVLDIEFAETEFAQEVKYLYDKKFLNSFSVGFIPREWERDPDGKMVYTEVELLETSAVPVPANAEANMIRTCKDAGAPLTEYKKVLNISEIVPAEDKKADAKAVKPMMSDADKIKLINRGDQKWIK